MGRRPLNRHELRAAAEAAEALGLNKPAERKPRSEPSERRPKPEAIAARLKTDADTEGVAEAAAPGAVSDTGA